jgi:hypothetical protein
MELPVADLAFRERLKEWLAQKHDMGVAVHDHAGRLLVGQSSIELETKLPEELHRAPQIADRQVDEESSRLQIPDSHFRILVRKEPSAPQPHGPKPTPRWKREGCPRSRF